MGPDSSEVWAHKAMERKALRTILASMGKALRAALQAMVPKATTAMVEAVVVRQAAAAAEAGQAAMGPWDRTVTHRMEANRAATAARSLEVLT